MLNLNSIRDLNVSPNILLYDVEMSFSISYHYDQWGVNIPWTHIKQRQFMISVAWKWFGEEEIHAVSLLDDPKRFLKDHTDDYHVIKTLRDLIEQADATVAFNGDRFDTKELNTGLIKHDLKPCHNYVQIDPCKIAKNKFRFKGGNSLANLCDFFALDVQKGKVELDDWIGATEGNPDSIEKIVEYNKGDIPTMEQVWNKIKPYAPAKLNLNHFIKGADVCPSCGGCDLSLHRRRKTTRATTRFQYKCQDCGHYMTTGKALSGVEMR